MKNILTFILTVSAILINSAQPTSAAAIEASKPEPSSTKPDTTPTWTVEISPAPGLDSYATREFHFPIVNGPDLNDSSEKATDSATDSIIVVPRNVPAVAPQPECSHCKPSCHPVMNRVTSRNRYSYPSSQNSYFANLQSIPALNMYSDLIRSNWFGTPYPGHSFYYSGYRPSFRFGSLQFRGFGNYDRMYNPRIIPFGYQYTGSRNRFAALALAEQYGF
ncbi:hypothetical protein [uncultured Gimesia sp.]|uniref:hypothetical protein n=1 Tax=uncultured Gimesia sp. TaxID=1678688 RepID=UPI0030D9F34F|tara:strand:- start:55224 stop:55883 length:660 start_codon:yes stop_codon:yes gene_type:complete